MIQEAKDQLRLRNKLLILELASVTGNVTKTCQEFKIPRSSFYEWKKKFQENGREGLIRKNQFL